MGEIKDGAISGVLPKARGFAVHYPGYPSSTSRAIETLGGIDEIAKKRSLGARRAESRPENRNESRLELRFRPEDPYCHPAFGDLRPCSSLLLRISKKKKAKKNKKRRSCSEERSPLRSNDDAYGDREEEPEPSTRLCADVVTIVDHAYHFKGMADYQYVLPVHAAKLRRKKRRWADMEPRFEKGGLMDIEQDDLMILVPKLFSPKDMPEEILLKQQASLNPKQQQNGVDQHWEMDIEPCLKISFEIEKIPDKVNWEDHISKDSTQWMWQMAISKLFDEQSIWPRRSLLERLLDDGLQVSYEQLRRLLPRSGYYFSTGPFGQFWIRRGYDPRSDPESRIYQRVDFRMRDILPISGDATTSYECQDFGKSNLVQNFGASCTIVESSQKWKDICRFQAFPSRSPTLQLFELDDDYIQQEIRKPAEHSTCTHSTGWFSWFTFRMLILRVKIRFLSIYPKGGVQKHLKSARSLFEKTRRDQFLSRVQGTDGEGDRLKNRGSNGHGPENSQIKSSEQEPMHDNEVEHDEREIEDEEYEEEEEELDEYELHPEVGGEDGGVSPNEGSHHMGESINVNYLQELLCNQITRDGNDYQSSEKVQGADISDDEYQIYEQDNNDSDDYL